MAAVWYRGSAVGEAASLGCCVHLPMTNATAIMTNAKATKNATATKKEKPSEKKTTEDEPDVRDHSKEAEVIREFSTPFFEYRPPNESRPYYTYRGWETVLRAFEGPGGRWGAFAYPNTTKNSVSFPTEISVSGETADGRRFDHVIITTSPAEADSVAYGLATGDITPFDSEELENRRCRTAKA